LALLGELPSVDYQQFIDKGANEELVYLSNWKTVVSGRLFVEDRSTPARLWEYHLLAEVC
jgi:hypothetical protein